MSRENFMSQRSKTTGYTVQDILNMDEYTLTHLTPEQLKPVVSQLANTANKRIKAMEKAHGKSSQAYRGVMKSGGKFGVKGKSYADLQKEVKREIRFLKHKTSTITGWNKVKRETIAELKKQGVKFTKEQWDDFFEAYDKLLERSPDVDIKNLKYSVFKEITAMMEDKSNSPDDIALELETKVNKVYEENKNLEEQRKSGGVSRYFKG